MPSTPASLDDYLMAIGKVVNNAMLTESFLFTAFKVLSKCSTRTANAIFYTSDTLQGKKSLLMRIVEVEGDGQDKDLIKAMIKEAEKSNTQRQEIAHAILLFTTKEPTAPPHLVIRPKARHARPLTKDWLSHLMHQSHEAGMACHQKLQILCEKHRVPPTPEI